MKKLFLTLALILSAVMSAWANVEWVQADVVKLDVVRGKVTLKHEPIQSIQMEAMTMPFKVKDAAQLNALKVGDKVRFTVVENDGELIIQQIEVRR